MKDLVKKAVVALAVAGISSAAAAPDRTTEGAAKGPEKSGGTGLSFEDLRVAPTGKVPVRIGSTAVPQRVAGDNCAPNPK